MLIDLFLDTAILSTCCESAVFDHPRVTHSTLYGSLRNTMTLPPLSGSNSTINPPESSAIEL